MRDCLILGSGRSGTSMVAGSLARSGYFLGDHLYSARACNPKGFFEAPEINGLNEALMAPSVPARPALGEGQRWLARLPEGAPLAQGPELTHRLATACAHRPFAYKDPRFSWTLPAWRPHLGDAGLVCVFRHPELTARSVLEEIRSADYLRGLAYDREDALAMWRDLYRRVLDERKRGGDFLFVHYDQVLGADGLERLGRFLDAPVDADFPERGLRRAPDAERLAPELDQLYAELCDLAEHRADPTRSVFAAPERPAVTAVLVLDDGTAHLARDAVESIRSQRGVDVDLRVVDASRAQSLALDGLEPQRLVDHSLGATLAAIGEGTSATYTALFDPRVGALPHRLAESVRALEQNADAEAVRCGLQQTGADGTFLAAVDPLQSVEQPWPLWQGTVTLRSRALAAVDRRAFRPALLERVRTLAAEDRLALLEEGLAPVDREVVARARERCSNEAEQLRLEARRGDGPPRMTVMLAHHRRPDAVFECLESFCHQTVPPSDLELIVIDDNSEPELVDELRALDLPVALTVLRQGGGGAGNARNLGLPHARGEYILFVNDDTIADPDLVERHLAAHAEIGAPAAVLGHFRQPTEELDIALTALLERTTLLFGYEAFEHGAQIGGSNLYTCNVSAPLDAVRAIGAFDPEFSHYGCEDTDLGLRLEDVGVPLYYRADCRALHRHRIGIETLTRRNPLVARAHARMFAKHPRSFGPWQTMAWSDEAEIRGRLDTAAPALQPLNAGLDSLAALDTGAVRRATDAFEPLAGALEQALEAQYSRRNNLLWMDGFLSGFDEQGAHRFEDLLARTPLEFDDLPGRPTLLPVRAESDGWLALTERFLASEDTGGDVLVLWIEPQTGVDPEALATALRPALHRAAQRGTGGQIALLRRDTHWSERGRVFGAADRWLSPGADDPYDAEDADIAAGAGVAEVDLAAWGGPVPTTLRATQPLRVMATLTAESIESLAAQAEPLLDADDACLVLAHDPHADVEHLGTALGQAIARRFGTERRLDVVLHGTDAAGLPSLTAACSIAITADTPSAELGRALDELRCIEPRALLAASLREPARDWRERKYA